MKAVEIYQREGCKFCARARQLLMARGVLFLERDITFADDLRQEMVRRSGKETTPQIFIGGEHIGGYEELRKLDESGELARKLSYSGHPEDLYQSHI